MSNVLFVAEGCPYSQRLIHAHGKMLQEVCDRIYYYNSKEGSTKRKKATTTAMEYHKIQQFPTLIWEGRRVLKSERLITRALDEALQRQPEMQVTNLKQTQEGGGGGGGAVGQADMMQHRMTGDGQLGPGNGEPIDHTSLRTAKVNTAELGAWPVYDAGCDPRRQQEAQQEMRQQIQQEYGPGGQQRQPHSIQSQQPQPPQRGAGGGNNVQGLQIGHDPHNEGTTGGYHGIGMGNMVGASETDLASNVDLRHNANSSHGQEQEMVGAWPTNRRVRGLTGAGVMGGGMRQQEDPFQAQHQQQRTEMFRQKGDVYQQSGAMAMQYGQPPAEPYRDY